MMEHMENTGELVNLNLSFAEPIALSDGTKVHFVIEQASEGLYANIDFFTYNEEDEEYQAYGHLYVRGRTVISNHQSHRIYESSLKYTDYVAAPRAVLALAVELLEKHYKESC